MINKEKILEKLIANPIFLKMVQEAEQEEKGKAERKDKARELAKLIAERSEVMAKLTEDVKKAQQGVKDARESLKQAQAVFGDAQGRAMSGSWRHDSAIREAEDYLFETAPESLKDSLHRLEMKLETVRSRPLAGEFVPDIPAALGFQVTAKRVGPSEVEERLEEIKEIEDQIEKVKEKILKGQ